jgi:predicted metal-dependent phosphoesterase TrpH
LIDLHSHTNESDGSLEPSELIEAAARGGVTTLAITDHDTLAGYDLALAVARAAGLELICGIELSTKLRGSSTHLLGYFPVPAALGEFRQWVRGQQRARKDRNIRLVARLRELGFEITLEEAEARGRGMTGRPHFAAILLEKGYVSDYRQAFDEYLDESAKGYVYRQEPTFAEGVAAIRKAGGIASLAHPTRVRGDVAELMPELCAAGLNAIEAYHSDHTAQETAYFGELARRYDLLVTGGSDFHGESVKPGVRLGTGYEGNLRVPPEVLKELRHGVAVGGTGDSNQLPGFSLMG